MFVENNRVFQQTNKRTTPQPSPPPQPEPQGYGLIPRWFMERTLGVECNYKRWLRTTFGHAAAQRLITDYYIGGNQGDVDAAIFWQVDTMGGVRTGKIMNYDPTTGKRIKGEGAYLGWVHSIMRGEDILPEGWQLRQCLYGEHLLGRRADAIVALAEGAKTAHVGAVLMPDMVWVAVDAMLHLSVERLEVLKGRSVILFPDEGRGYKEWSERIGPIADSVGFSYAISDFLECQAHPMGGDIADIVP